MRQGRFVIVSVTMAAALLSPVTSLAVSEDLRMLLPGPIRAFRMYYGPSL